MRPTKLTPELQEKICGIILKGNYISTACQACGIGESTYYRWIEEGEKAESGEVREFWEAVKKVEAEAEQKLLDRIELASIDSWQAAAWMLERKEPGKWGRKDRLSFKDEKGKPSRLEIVIVRSRKDAIV